MSKKHLPILVAILALGAFLRFWQLDLIPPGLYPDEAINGNDALQSPGRVFYPENNGREGLFHNLLALSFTIFGPSVWALRAIPAIIGTLTVLAVYLLTKELVELSTSNLKTKSNNLKLKTINLAPLLSAFFIAASFWHINFSRIGFRAILLPLVLTFSFYFLLKGIRLHQFNHFLASALFFGLGFYTYISFRLAILILPFIFIPYWLWAKKQNQQDKFFEYTLWWLAIVVIVALPIAIYFIQNPQDFISRASGISVFAQPEPIKAFGQSLIKHLGMFHIFGDPNWRHNFAGRPMLPLFIGIFFLIGVILSFKHLIQNFHDRGFFAMIPFSLIPSWFAAMLLPGILTAEGLPHALRVIGAIPPVYILSSIGGVWLYEKLKLRSKNPKLISYAALLILASITITEYDFYFNKWARRLEVKGAFSQNFVKMGQYLNSLPSDAQKYVVVNEPGVPVPFPDGIPMPAQTLMFIERTAGKLNTARYLKPNQIEANVGLTKSDKAMVLIMKEDASVIMQVLGQVPDGKLDTQDDFWIVSNF